MKTSSKVNQAKPLSVPGYHIEYSLVGRNVGDQIELEGIPYQVVSQQATRVSPEQVKAVATGPLPSIREPLTIYRIYYRRLYK